MASLNIRNFPPDLLKALKVEAARRGITLRELVIEKTSLRYDILIGHGKLKEKEEK